MAHHGTLLCLLLASTVLSCLAADPKATLSCEQQHFCKRNINIVPTVCKQRRSWSVCPAEPAFTTCPAECTRCVSGRCEIEIATNSGQIVACPAGIPCLVRCLGFCTGTTVVCPPDASCDLGICDYSTMVCSGPYSCSAQCDGWTSLATQQCDPNVSCNCASTCTVLSKCTPGIDCYGDPCYRAFDEEDMCYTFRPDFEAQQISTYQNGVCGCECRNSTYVRIEEYDSVTGRDGPFCVPPEKLCMTDDDCPVHSYCAGYECTCYSDWTGPNCTEKRCPQCKNGGSCGLNNDCRCVGGFSGPTCEDYTGNCTAPLLNANTPCPAGCDYCNDGYCVVHLRAVYIEEWEEGEYTIMMGCPTTSTLPCKMICDRPDCLNSEEEPTECTPGAPCDIVCVGDSCSSLFVACSGPDCRVHCPASSPEIYAVICLDPSACTCNYTGCDMWGFDDCQPGITCPGDVCSWGIDGCDNIYFDSVAGECACHCPVNQTYSEIQLQCIDNELANCECPSGYCGQQGCVCTHQSTGADCDEGLASCKPFAISSANSQCPPECQDCLTIDGFETCRVSDLVEDFVCPSGWACIVQCFANECKNITITCPSTALSCDLICVGVESCFASELVCASQHACRAHCVAPTASIYDLRCSPHSCECSTTCPRTKYTDPCFDRYSAYTGIHWEEYEYKKNCGYATNGQEFLPVATSNGTCECVCEDIVFEDEGGAQCKECAMQCLNGGECIVAMNDDDEMYQKCVCYSGWNGPTCNTRCYFPIPDVVIVRCGDGVYILQGQLEVKNGTYDISSQPDIKVVVVGGNVSISEGSTISLGSGTTIVLMNVSGDCGGAGFGGTLILRLSLVALRELLGPNGELLLPIATYGYLMSRYDNIVIELEDPDDCSQVSSDGMYDPQAFSILFKLDESSCSSGIGGGTIAVISIAVVLVVCGTLVGFFVVMYFKQKKRSVADQERLRNLSHKAQSENSPSIVNTTELQETSEWTRGAAGSLRNTKD